MVILSQRDPKWSTVKMLPSHLTIGRYGCLLTCMCMLSDWYGCFVLPSQAIGQEVSFNTEGHVIWSKVNFSTFKFVERLRQFDPAKIDASLRGKETSCVLSIDRDSHWVVALRRFPSGWYWVADPWDGKKRFLNMKRISGSAHFIRK